MSSPRTDWLQKPFSNKRPNQKHATFFLGWLRVRLPWKIYGTSRQREVYSSCRMMHNKEMQWYIVVKYFSLQALHKCQNCSWPFSSGCAAGWFGLFVWIGCLATVFLMLAMLFHLVIHILTVNWTKFPRLFQNLKHTFKQEIYLQLLLTNTFTASDMSTWRLVVPSCGNAAEPSEKQNKREGIFIIRPSANKHLAVEVNFQILKTFVVFLELGLDWKS